MNSIHRVKPQRTCTKIEKNYKNYKEDLRGDFNQRCGYCDDWDYYYGGKRIYHIDHFKPHSISKFLPLKHEYSNLVYSCPFCNISKSNKWQDINGFIDPCNKEYDNHIKRDNSGKIIYISSQGEYIWKNLKLYLRRHELLWILDKLENQKNKLDNIIDKLGENHLQEVEILREFRKIQKTIDKYINLYRKELD